MRSACATADRFVPSDSVSLSLIVKTGAHSSRGDLSLGFLPWEALFVRAVDGRGPVWGHEASSEDRESA